MFFKIEDFFWLMKGNGIFVKGSNLIFVLMFLKIWNSSIMIKLFVI